MNAVVRTRKIGGSLSVTIPKEIVQEERIRAGQAIIIQIQKIKSDYFGALKNITSFKKEDELDIDE